MRKLILTFVAAVATLLSLTSCEKEGEKILDFSSLPTQAQTTITESFDKDDIMLIVLDNDITDKEYIVTFHSGTIIEFDKDGAWESVKAYIDGVPASIIPNTIAKYLSEKYADIKVTEIDKDKDGYDIYLSNLLELEFNLAGALVGVDMF